MIFTAVMVPVLGFMPAVLSAIGIYVLMVMTRLVEKPGLRPATGVMPSSREENKLSSAAHYGRINSRSFHCRLCCYSF